MIWICAHCNLGINLVGVLDRKLVGEESEFWPDNYDCPTCSNKLVVYQAKEISPSILTMMEVIDVDSNGLFSILSGMGLPEETKCTPDVVKDLFESSSVQHVTVTPLPQTSRSILKSITFNSGHTLYLGTSAYGPVVYRVSSPPGENR